MYNPDYFIADFEFAALTSLDFVFVQNFDWIPVQAPLIMVGVYYVISLRSRKAGS